MNDPRRQTFSGHMLKGYAFRQRIGTGSFGAVYRAEQVSVGRPVAIKVILPIYANLPDFVRRFETEAQLIARLEHPHVVPLFDYWRDPDGAYLVMRLLPSSLRMMLSDGPIPVQEAALLSDQMASALAFSHRQGIVHRDIKPDNILMDDDGNAYLSDFGLAEVIQASSDQPDGRITGSPAYMSPEQLKGEIATIQSDIYGLGVVFYEMLTGEHPYAELSISDLIQKQLFDPLPPLQTYRGDLPERVNTVLQKATSKNHAERYPDVETLARNFHEALFQHTETLALISQQVEVENPYKGLRPFAEADAPDFFGREQMVAQVIRRFEEDHPLNRFLAIVGPSGSGKSSLVQAGVIPALRNGALPESSKWYIMSIIPTAQPLKSLETGLLGVAVRPIPDLFEQLQTDERALFAAAEQILDETDGELVLVIDQLEELFTLVSDEAERAQFLNLIQAAVTAENSCLRIIVTLRADFYDRPLLYEAFGVLMQARTQIVLPLNESELERAITAPANNVGVQLEPNLTAAILADVYEEPGALPLLQYALTEVFARRQGRLMTLQGYEDINRISGALARRADRVYESMSSEEQAIARQVFLRLITIGEGSDDMRRRASRSELLSVVNDHEQLDAVLDLFGRHRLLSFDHDPGTREPTVQMAHEALLREWRMLRRWLDEGRADIVQQRRLARLAEEWLESGRDRSFLLRGSQLEQFEDWLATTDIALTEEEETFVKAGLVAREERVAAERIRQEREITLEKRARRFQRWLIGVLLVATVIASGLSVVAFQQRIDALDARREAEDNAEIAQTQASSAATAAAVASLRANELQSLALVSDAERALDENNPDLALALAMEAIRIPDAPINADNLLSALLPTAAIRVFEGHTGHIDAVAINGDGTLALSGSDDNSLIVWYIETGEALRSLNGHTGHVRSVAFVPNTTLAVSGADDSTLILWDYETGEMVRSFVGHEDDVFSVAVHPDGSQIASGSRDSTIILWDLASGDMVRQFGSTEQDAALGHSRRVTCVAFRPDGTRLVSGSADNTLIVWDVATGEILARLAEHSDTINDVAYDPTGKYILSASTDMTLILWDAATFARVQRFEGHTERVTSVAFSPDGLRAVSGAGNQFAGASTDNSLILWDVASGNAIHRYIGHTFYIGDVAFSPGGRTILSGANDNTLRLWSAENDIEFTRVTTHAGLNAAAFSADGTFVLGAMADDHIEGFDLDYQTGFVARYHQDESPHMEPVTAIALNADGTQALMASTDHTISVWDVASGEVIQTLAGHSNDVNGVVFSPDGTQALSASRDRSLILWDLATGEPIRHFDMRHTNAVNAVTFSPDGTLAASGSDDQSLILWDTATGEALKIMRGHRGQVEAVTFSPDGRYVLSGSHDKSLILWDVATGTIVRQFIDGHTDWVTAVAFSADGQYILSGSRDRSIVLWSTATGEIIRRDDGHSDTIVAVQFASSGNYAFSAAVDGVIRLWPGSRSLLVDWVTGHRHIRPLTCDERDFYRLAPCEAAD